MLSNHSRYLILIALGFLVLAMSSCAPTRYFFMNSEGIFSYNRHTGQLEIVWETKTFSQAPDSVQVSKK